MAFTAGRPTGPRVLPLCHGSSKAKLVRDVPWDTLGFFCVQATLSCDTVPRSPHVIGAQYRPVTNVTIGEYPFLKAERERVPSWAFVLYGFLLGPYVALIEMFVVRFVAYSSRPPRSRCPLLLALSSVHCCLNTSTLNPDTYNYVALVDMAHAAFASSWPPTLFSFAGRASSGPLP